MWPRLGSLVPGPIEPATKRGRPSAAYPSATSRAMRAAATLSSWARSATSYSASTVEKLPKLAVSTTSTPTSKNAACIPAITSGRVRQSISLQPSSATPPKSSAPRSRPCTYVPKAPSKTTTRSRTASRYWWAGIGTRLVARLARRDGRLEPERLSVCQVRTAPVPVVITVPGMTRSRNGSTRSTPNSGASGDVHGGMIDGS